MRYVDERGAAKPVAIIRDILIGMVVLIGVLMWGLPIYRVWQQGLAGQSELARAEYNRKIAIQEAEAKKESAVMLAQAEITRAEGVAKANQIIGLSLKGNEAYLRYLWIDTLAKDDKQIIYVPTEAGMPILEAGKRP